MKQFGPFTLLCVTVVGIFGIVSILVAHGTTPAENSSLITQVFVFGGLIVSLISNYWKQTQIREELHENTQITQSAADNAGVAAVKAQRTAEVVNNNLKACTEAHESMIESLKVIKNGNGNGAAH